jgi:RimJ/RimL family protein N-acetyltransferase
MSAPLQNARNFSGLRLATARLQLRPLRENDAPMLLYIRSRPDVMRYHSSGPWKELAQAEQLIARDLAAMAAGEYLRLALVLHGEDAIIGNCCLFHLDAQSRRAEVGYDLHPDHWRKGYMNEALFALLGYGFAELGLNRVEADIHPDNTASARTLEKLGFAREGLLRERWIVEGEVSDSLIYGLLARDWQRGNRATLTAQF